MAEYLRNAIIEICKISGNKIDLETKQARIYDYILSREFSRKLVSIDRDNSEMIAIQDKEDKELPNQQKERDFYLSDNEFLKNKNCELNDECNSLLAKIESQNKLLEITKNEIDKKRELLDTITDSEEYVTLKNKVEKHINDFLNQRREFFKLTIVTILDIIKKDPK